MLLDQHPQVGDPSGSERTDSHNDRTHDRATAVSQARPTGLASAIGRLLGPDLPIAISCYDGSRIGPDNSDTALVIRSPKALRYAVTAPGELGIAWAYVSGELDIEGDIFSGARSARSHARCPARRGRVDRPGSRGRRCRSSTASATARRGPVARSAPLEGTGRGRDRGPLRRLERLLPNGSRSVDDLLVRGVAFDRRALETAESSKYELVLSQARTRARDATPRRRLRLGRHGDARPRVTTASARSESRSRMNKRNGPAARCTKLGLDERVEIRVQDYRDVRERTVRRGQLDRYVRTRRRGAFDEYFATLYKLVRPGGRLLNHGISRPRVVRTNALDSRPTGFHRSLRVSRRGVARGRQRSSHASRTPASKHETSKACASTTR